MQIKLKNCSTCNQEKLLSEFYSNFNTKDGLSYQCKQCQKNYIKEYNSKNKIKKAEYDKNYRIIHKEELKKRRNQYEKIRKQTDINYKLKLNSSIRLNKALQYNWKSGRTIELLGCSIEQLKIHLENQFTKGMNWDNYGIYGWHIDHILPCASFDLSNPKEQSKCFHYSNLQPLWAKDNRAKWHKIDRKIMYGF